jgi:hypothetical protein
LSPALVLATDFYVDTAGTDNATCGDSTYGADACATPQYVLNGSSANGAPARGDTIYIDDGTYTKYGTTGSFEYVVLFENTLSGTGYLTLQARNDNQAVFDLESTTSSPAGYCAIVSYTNNVTGVKFEGINFTRCERAGARMALNGGVSNDIWFDKCKFYNIGRGYSGQLHGGINFAGITGSDENVGATTPIKITRSEFYDIGRQDPEQDDGYDHAVYGTGSYDIENTIIRDHYAGYHLKFQGGDYHVYNNTFAENHQSGISGGAFYFSSITSEAIFANNAFTDIKGDTYYGRGGGCDDAGDAAKISWYNNMSDVNIVGAGYCESQNSGWAADSNNTGSKTQAALGFTDVSGNDYSIGANSDLLEGGHATYAPADDYIGTSRPQGSLDDIGAYEFEQPTNPIDGMLIQ